jgi:hypothetical protein
MVSDLKTFNKFVAEHLANHPDSLSLEESVVAFRAYQAELNRFKQDIAPAIAELDSTGGQPFDLNAIVAAGNDILRKENADG